MKYTNKIAMMRTIFCLLLCGLLSGSLSAQEVSIIPKPVSLKTSPGTFTITKSTVIVIPQESDRNSANFLNDYLMQVLGYKLAISKQASSNAIRLSTKAANPSKEAYTMGVNASGITITGDSPEGTFWGMQTLVQLLPVEKSASAKIPFVSIEDQPRFSYRGLHLDVGRHMFPVSFIKKYIDYIALHKMNYFHWHLTEDQGWRIEIKKYPLLTSVGGYRDGTIIGRAPGTGNTNKRYGGFYTQEEVKEVVKYATERHVNVIPEIEMPGHAQAALASYPFLGCPGTGPYSVAQGWGVFDDIYCAGKDSTFKFLEDVLDEVIPLFPNKYVHIGGDEAPKNNWHICPLCQKRIKDNNLKDEHGLQSYFIQRMEKYINSKGKTIIGWDEILEGGLAPNALVMSWRGEAGGIEAAKQHHQVIMTPGTYVYLDHSQTTQDDSVTIGSYLPVENVYKYDPVPKELSADEAKYVLGAQGNVWTEYMPNTKKVEYMLFPRISALSEVLWSPIAGRTWTDFEPRLLKQFQRYSLWGNNYSTAFFDIQTSIAPSPDHNGVVVSMSSKYPSAKLRYGLKGAALQDYTSPIPVKQSGQINGVYYTNGKLADSVGLKLNINKATGKTITLTNPAMAGAPGNGPFTLVDGIINEVGGRSLQSLGFETDAEAVIDLAGSQQISSVTVHALNAGGTTVYPPESISIFISADGQTFRPVSATANPPVVTGPKNVYKLTFTPENARYVKVFVKRLPKVPEGRRGAGGNTLLYLDEIQID